MAARSGWSRPTRSSRRSSTPRSASTCRGSWSASCATSSGGRKEHPPLLLTRRIEFSASHRLWRADWDDARNAAAFGARSARAERGHNYVLEVTLDGPIDAETGMVIDLKRVKDVVEREIAARFDHKQLNADTPWFRDRAPTAENFARVIFDLLDAAFPDGLLAAVRLWPTSDWFVEVAR